MNYENCVIFKGTSQGLTVLLNPEIDFSILKDQLKKKTVEAKKFFEGATVSLFFKGRILTEKQQYELVEIISEETKLNISYIHQEDEVKSQVDKNEGIVAEKLLKEQFKSNVDLKKFEQDITKFYKGTIRSGQSIEFSGSVIVVGDINPGGEVIAGGNIIVLGSLIGTVHAGNKGNEKAFVAALQMVPMQLRIANVITRAPDQNGIKDTSNLHPEIAYLQQNRIYIEPIDYKILENL
jgi:septum site-determining protein MinC